MALADLELRRTRVPSWRRLKPLRPAVEYLVLENANQRSASGTDVVVSQPYD